MNDKIKWIINDTDDTVNLSSVIDKIKNLETEVAELKKFILEESSCPEADGFEGKETFPDCLKDDCVYCKLKGEADE